MDTKEETQSGGGPAVAGGVDKQTMAVSAHNVKGVRGHAAENVHGCQKIRGGVGDVVENRVIQIGIITLVIIDAIAFAVEYEKDLMRSFGGSASCMLANNVTGSESNVWSDLPSDLCQYFYFPNSNATLSFNVSYIEALPYPAAYYDCACIAQATAEAGMEWFSFAIVIIFVVETILKLFAFAANYFRDIFNAIDFVVVCGSFVASILSLILTLSEAAATFGGAVLFLRIFRLARIMRILTHGRRKLQGPRLSSLNVSVPAERAIFFLSGLRMDYILSVRESQVPEKLISSGKKGGKALKFALTREDLDEIEFAISAIASNKLYDASFGKDKINAENKEEEDLNEGAVWLRETFQAFGYGTKPNNYDDNDKSNPFTREILSLFGENKSMVLRSTFRSDVEVDDEEKAGVELQSMRQPSVAFGVKGVDDKVMSELDKWDFDIFGVEQMTSAQPLVAITMAALRSFNIVKKIGMDEGKLAGFIQRVQENYIKSNPFHNAVHASDVVQTSFFFLRKGGLYKYANDLDAFSLLVGACVHDVGHVGVNNQFLIATKHDLATKYNDKSVLESFHISRAFSIALSDPASNPFASLTPEQYRYVRHQMITMVLGTDMAFHFESVGTFKNRVGGSGFDPKVAEDRTFVLKLGLHCADISNPVKVFPTVALYIF
uniref:Phosphodiesterase n=1 Tax=Palpitomonas bilix TaxID=652834 RepID=A0A7S3GJU2_9EUKA